MAASKAGSKPQGNAQGPVQFQAQPIVVTNSGVQGLSGAQNATLVLGLGLVAVSLWRDTLAPLLRSAWSGEQLAITVPPGGILAETVFVGALVFIGSLSDDFAQLAFWLVAGLWAVFLVTHPAVVTTAAGWLTQNTQAAAHQHAIAQGAQQDPGPQTSQGGRAPHTSSF